MPGLPYDAFDLLVRTLARICDDPYDRLFPDARRPDRRVCLCHHGAIWARASTDEQESGNQLAELRRWAGRRGLEIADAYVVDGQSIPQLDISGDTGVTSLIRLARR